MRTIGTFGAVLLAAALLVQRAAAGDEARSNLWFDVGETTTYRAYWGVILVGSGTFSSEWIKEEGRDLLAIRFTARSSKVISAIYTVEDDIEVIVDPTTFLPLRYKQHIREGKRIRDEVTVFDHTAKTAVWSSEQKNTNKVIQIDADTRDILSFMYYMRSQGYAAGQVQNFRVLVDTKVYDFTLTGIGKETVFIRGFGRIECLEVKPDAKFGAMFERHGSMNAWFSTDKRHILCKFTAKLPLCSLRAVLDDVGGPGATEWKKKR